MKASTIQQLSRTHYHASSVRVKLYNILRLAIFPVEWFAELLNGMKGEVLCLGCGYGILETILAAKHPELNFIASDLTKQRIQAAKRSVKGLSNITFASIDATKVEPTETYENILFIDLLHHLVRGEQVKLLDRLWSILRNL